jgi:hypothetical protein
MFNSWSRLTTSMSSASWRPTWNFHGVFTTSKIIKERKNKCIGITKSINYEITLHPFAGPPSVQQRLVKSRSKENHNAWIRAEVKGRNGRRL